MHTWYTATGCAELSTTRAAEVGAVNVVAADNGQTGPLAQLPAIDTAAASLDARSKRPRPRSEIVRGVAEIGTKSGSTDVTCITLNGRTVA